MTSQEIEQKLSHLQHYMVSLRDSFDGTHPKLTDEQYHSNLDGIVVQIEEVRRALHDVLNPKK